MNPVNAITAIAGTRSVPRAEVSQGPRIGLRQDSGRNRVAAGRVARWTDGSGKGDGCLARSVAVRSGFGGLVTDKVDPLIYAEVT